MDQTPPNFRCIENCERSFPGGERNKVARIACQQGYRGGTGFPTLVKFKIKDRMECNTSQNN